jgi:hypothetical protein
MALSQRNFEALQQFAAYAPATVTATGAGSAIDLLGYDGDVVFVMQATAAGSAAAFKVRIEESDTTTAGDFTAITGGGFTDIGNAAYVGSVAISKDDVKRYLRVNIYEETGTASSIISVTGFGVKKYQ